MAPSSGLRRTREVIATFLVAILLLLDTTLHAKIEAAVLEKSSDIYKAAYQVSADDGPRRGRSGPPGENAASCPTPPFYLLSKRLRLTL